MKINVLFLSLCVFFMASCKKDPKGNTALNAPTQVLEFKDNQYKELVTDFVDSIGFLSLKEKEGAFLTAINKLIITDNRIYLFDRMGENSLMAFDLAGNFATKFGEKGNAKNEYIRLSDFDVDSNYVYLYDRAKQKMLFYTHSGQFVKSTTTSFRGEGFKVLKDSKILFSLAKEEHLNKLVLTDSLLTIQETLLKYSEDELDDKVTDNLFQKINDTIYYNKAVSDTVYMFSAHGRLVGSYSFNFDNNNVPSSEKESYEQLLKNKGKEKYVYMSDCPLFVRDKVIGTVFNQGNKATALYDIKNKRSGIMDWVEGIELKDIILPIYATPHYIIGWMDYSVYNLISDKASLPTPLLEHLKDGGRILVYYYI